MGLAKGRGRGKGGITKAKTKGVLGKPPPLMGRIAPPLLMRPRGPVPPLIPRMRLPPPGMRNPRLLPPPMPPVLGGPRPPLPPPPFHPPPHGRPMPPPLPLRPPVPPPSLLRARGHGMPPPLIGMRGPGFRPPGPLMLPKFGPGKRNAGVMKNAKKKQKGRKMDSGDESEMNKPWVTEAMKNEIQKKHKLYQKAKKSNQQTDWDEFKEQRNRVTTMIREAKLEYIGSHPEEVGNFFCENCDQQFSLATDMNDHLSIHQSCGMEGCTFSAEANVLAKHIETQHLSGIFSKIGSLESPEDIKNWIAERKRRYPTRENVERRRAEQNERFQRGEKLTKDTSLFNKDLKGKRGQTRSKRGRPKRHEVPGKEKRRKFEFAEERDSDEDEIQLSRGGVPRFAGTRAFEEESTMDVRIECSGNDHEYSDTEWESCANSKPIENAVPAVSKALTSLMNLYASDASDSDDGVPVEVPIQRTEGNLSSALSVTINVQGNVDSTERYDTKFKDCNSVSPASQSNLSLPVKHEREESRTSKILDDSLPNNSQTNGANRSKKYTKAKNKQFNRQFGSKEGPARGIRQYPPKPRKKTLLEKLLEKEIRHERNVILQCIHHIVEKNFFEDKSAVNKGSTELIKNMSDHAISVVFQSARYIVKRNFFGITKEL